MSSNNAAGIWINRARLHAVGNAFLNWLFFGIYFILLYVCMSNVDTSTTAQTMKSTNNVETSCNVSKYGQINAIQMVSSIHLFKYVRPSVPHTWSLSVGQRCIQAEPVARSHPSGSSCNRCRGDRGWEESQAKKTYFSVCQIVAVDQLDTFQI